MTFAGSVCGDDMGYCDIMYVCRIVDADGPIASLGNYVFNGVLFDAAQNLAQEYWYDKYLTSYFLLLFTVYWGIYFDRNKFISKVT